MAINEGFLPVGLMSDGIADIILFYSASNLLYSQILITKLSDIGLI